MRSWVTSFLVAPVLLVLTSIAVDAADFSVKFYTQGLGMDGRTEITADANTRMYGIQQGELFYADVILNISETLPVGATKWTGADVAFGWDKDLVFDDKLFFLQGSVLTDDWTCDYGNYGHFKDWDGSQGSAGVWNIVQLAGGAAIVPGTEYTIIEFCFLNNMALGNAADLRLWNAARGTDSMDPVATTALSTDLGYYMPDSSAPVEGPYTMSSIPEPSSLMAMGCAGVGVLGNLLHRRRKKTSAKH